MHINNVLIDAVNIIRDRHNRQFSGDMNYIHACIQDLVNNDALRKHPSVIALVKDFTNKDKLPTKLIHVKESLYETDMILSFFSVSYFPSLSFDACWFERILEPKYLLNTMRSPVAAIKTIAATTGFQDRTVVALFPENHIDHVQDSDDRIFYFIDKFINRYYKITHKLLNIVHSPLKSILLECDTAQIESLAVHWVWLHEHFHRQGPMPIPKYLHYKSIKPLAGLEELRVDLASIDYCMKSMPEPFNLQCAVFILFERLLRYAIEGQGKPNYDAIASQVLFNYLKKHKYITTDQNYQLYFDNNIFQGTARFAAEIASIEDNIDRFKPEIVQQQLLDFVQAYQTNPTNGIDFKHDAYFSHLKQLYSV